jgi:hypothetical protein
MHGEWRRGGRKLPQQCVREAYRKHGSSSPVHPGPFTAPTLMIVAEYHNDEVACDLSPPELCADGGDGDAWQPAGLGRDRSIRLGR